MPASRVALYIAAEVASSASPPKDIVPKHSSETCTPVRPRGLNFMCGVYRAIADNPPMDFRPDAEDFLRDPFAVYRRLREEDPVHWSPRLKSWVLTRYDDVRQVLLDREVSSDRMRPFFATLPGPEAARIASIIRYLSTWMVFRDPPEHTRLRRLTGKVFHLQSMNAMRPRIEALVERLLVRISDRREIDFVADFAGPLPALVIMAMLGVPQEELEKVKRLSDDMALFIGSSRMSPEKYDIAERATREMAAFFRDLIERRR